MQAAEESLRRLGTDYIDIYYLHKEDHATPLAETVRAIGDLLRQGKIRYFGVSNYKSWRVAEICNLCDRMGIDRPIVSQPYYHALYRVAEVEQLPACAYYGLGVVSYSPLARGVLTGKYQPGAEAAEGHARGPRRQAHAADRISPRDARGRAEGEGLLRRSAASRRNHFAVAWVLNNRLISGVVAGPRTEAQWDDYVKALDFKFTQGGRGVHQRSRRHRPSGGAGLQRSGLSDRGPRGADRLMQNASTIDEAEVARFSALAEEWWDPRGKMAVLHKFNPVRLGYIRDAACKRFERDPKQLDCLKGLRILDIGCGGGILCEPLARLGANVVGADPAETNIAAAKLHAEQGGLAIDYRATTAEALADAGERFDIVLAMEVVEHVADVKLFVARCAEMVKPGGLMIAATLNRTLKSFALAIVGAEYMLRWLPRGTHQLGQVRHAGRARDRDGARGLARHRRARRDLQSARRPLAALDRHRRELHGDGGEGGVMPSLLMPG